MTSNAGRENLKDEAHRDEGYADSGQCREQSRTGRVTANTGSKERGRDFEQAAKETCDEGDLPSQVGVVGFVVNRTENEEDEREKADRVNAEGKGGDRFARLLRKPVGLPGVKEVSRDERHRDSRKNATHHQALRQSRQCGAQTDDHDQLAKVIYEETEKAVDVVGDKPSPEERFFDIRVVGGHKIIPP
jgi:hypothetical protein